MNICIPTSFPYYEYVKEQNEDSILKILKFGINVMNIAPISDNKISPTLYVTKDERFNYLQNNFSDLKLEIAKISSLIGSGTKRGKVSENLLINNLHKLLPDAEINDTGYKIGKGDVYIHYKGYNIMIEIKNYSTNIPRTEKDKFHKDLIQNTYDAGILMSCKSGITGSDKRFEYKFLGTKFAIYLSNSGIDGDSVMWAVQFIVSALDLFKRINMQEECKSEIIILYIQSQSLSLENCLNDISNISNEMHNIKSNVNRIISNGINNMEISINITKQKLDNLIVSFKQLEKGSLHIDMNIFQQTICAGDETKANNEFQNKKVFELKTLAKKMGLNNISKKKKDELIKMIENAMQDTSDTSIGIIENKTTAVDTYKIVKKK